MYVRPGMNSSKERVLEEKLSFLRKYEPGPLSESFHGDISLIGCDQQPVYAHRFILAGRSEVFKRMFESDMKEKETGIVRIEDATAPVLRSMVNYCYIADIVFTPDAAAEEVVKVADKYELSRLRSMCLSRLSEDITTDNVCDRLVIAELYKDDNLKRSIIIFLEVNPFSIYSEVAERLRKR